MSQTKKFNRSKKSPGRQNYQTETRECDYYEERSDEDESPIRRWFRQKARSTSTPFYGSRKYSSVSCDTTDEVSQSSEVIQNETPLTNMTRSFSIGSEFSGFGDGTVAKLDVLLNQIEDIKKSVVEMDNDLYSVNKVMKSKNFLRLTVNPDDESGEQTGLSDTGPHSPSLEWDSNDIVEQASPFVYNQQITPRRPSDDPDTSDSASSCQVLSNTARRNPSSPSMNLPLDTFSVSSSSGHGSSLVSSPGSDRDKKLHYLIEEARKLGLVNDLLEALLKNIKRDSAYFED